MELILAGRATNEFKERKIPVEEIVGNTVKNWIKKNLRFLDPEKDIRIVCRIGAGSQDLTELFQRFGKGEIPLANDTSMGVGFYPFTTLEQQVLQIEQLLNNVKTKQRFPWVGEDIKVMGLRTKTGAKFTIAIAMVDRFIPDIKTYQLYVAEIKQFISGKPGMEDTVIEINSADNYDQQSVYLTVTGLSAEAGDDGEVGRGNRYNGLITPYRPMSLEAFAGKNPVSHVGKIYNLFAFELSKAICEQGFAEEAQVFIVSQIGKPITEPQLLDIRVNRSLVDTGRIEQLARLKLEEIPTLWKQIISR
jgi:S-adenosylmethionine synthetase